MIIGNQLYWLQQQASIMAQVKMQAEDMPILQSTVLFA
jgi:hypothetical protein